MNSMMNIRDKSINRSQTEWTGCATNRTAGIVSEAIDTCPHYKVRLHIQYVQDTNIIILNLVYNLFIIISVFLQPIVLLILQFL